MPYLRPVEAAALARYTCCIPDDAAWRTQLWGAIADLLDSWRWEGESDLTDDEIASAYLAVINSFERNIPMIGEITMYGGDSAPDNWLWCNGSLISQSAFADLFTVIGYKFGGSSPNFRIPDMRQRSPFGAIDPTANSVKLGSSVQTLTEAQIPAHTHSVHNHLSALALAPGELPVTIPSILPGVTGSTGGGGSHDNMHPVVTLNYIIRYQGDC